MKKGVQEGWNQWRKSSGVRKKKKWQQEWKKRCIKWCCMVWTWQWHWCQGRAGSSRWHHLLKQFKTEPFSLETIRLLLFNQSNSIHITFRSDEWSPRLSWIFLVCNLQVKSFTSCRSGVSGDTWGWDPGCHNKERMYWLHYSIAI